MIILSEMGCFRRVFFLLLIFLIDIQGGAAEKRQQRIITGWLEKIVLSPWQVKLTAKLDSGAKTSSLHAGNIQYFDRGERTWVRFDLPSSAKKKHQLTVEAPLLRQVKIKQHQLPPAIRPVVEIEFCIDGYFYKTQFTLADRRKFNYPVLLGRRFLKGKVLIDPSATFIHHSDSCQDQ